MSSLSKGGEYIAELLVVVKGTGWCRHLSGWTRNHISQRSQPNSTTLRATAFDCSQKTPVFHNNPGTMVSALVVTEQSLNHFIYESPELRREGFQSPRQTDSVPGGEWIHCDAMCTWIVNSFLCRASVGEHCRG